MSGPVTIIRAREAADLEACVRALAIVHEVSGYPSNWPAEPARWLSPAGLQQAWVAVANETTVAGHVGVRQPSDAPTEEDGAEVARLFVVPPARRQGIAQALLRQAMHWAVVNDCGLTLEVTGHLQAARALYETTGFHLVGTRRPEWTTPQGQPVTLYRYAWHQRYSVTAHPRQL